jgi:hypothetical protein
LQVNTTRLPFLPAAVWVKDTSLPSITLFSLVSAIGALVPQASGPSPAPPPGLLACREAGQRATVAIVVWMSVFTEVVMDSPLRLAEHFVSLRVSAS